MAEFRSVTALKNAALCPSCCKSTHRNDFLTDAFVQSSCATTTAFVSTEIYIDGIESMGWNNKMKEPIHQEMG